jgi:hypothetical protein
LTFQPRPLQVLVLPACEVRVLDAQLRERRGQAAREGAVERRRFAHEHAHRPAVGDEVVHGQQEQLLLVFESQDGGSQQQFRGEVERPPRLLFDQPRGARLARGLGQPPQVYHLQSHGARQGDDLHGLAVHEGEGGAQRVVPPDDLA